MREKERQICVCICVYTVSDLHLHDLKSLLFIIFLTALRQIFRDKMNMRAIQIYSSGSVWSAKNSLRCWSMDAVQRLNVTKNRLHLIVIHLILICKSNRYYFLSYRFIYHFYEQTCWYVREDMLYAWMSFL